MIIVVRSIVVTVGIAVAIALGGCSIKANYDGTQYRCNASTLCPSGYTCDQGVCARPSGHDAMFLVDAPVIPTPDAPLGAPDASPLYPPWWDTSYAHRRAITVHANADEALPAGFPVMVDQDIEALIGTGAPYQSVRVVHWDAATSTWT